jgi:hypothetical protein
VTAPVRRLCGSFLGFGPFGADQTAIWGYFHFVSNNLHFVSRPDMMVAADF